MATGNPTGSATVYINNPTYGQVKASGYANATAWKNATTKPPTYIGQSLGGLNNTIPLTPLTPTTTPTTPIYHIATNTPYVPSVLTPQAQQQYITNNYTIQNNTNGSITYIPKTTQATTINQPVITENKVPIQTTNQVQITPKQTTPITPQVTLYDIYDTQKINTIKNYGLDDNQKTMTPRIDYVPKEAYETPKLVPYSEPIKGKKVDDSIQGQAYQTFYDIGEGAVGTYKYLTTIPTESAKEAKEKYPNQPVQGILYSGLLGGYKASPIPIALATATTPRETYEEISANPAKSFGQFFALEPIGKISGGTGKITEFTRDIKVKVTMERIPTEAYTSEKILTATEAGKKIYTSENWRNPEKVVKQFKNNKYAFDGKTGGWSETPTPIQGTIVKGSTSESPGLFIAPEQSRAFLKLAKPNENYVTKITIFPKASKPTSYWVKPTGVSRIPPKIIAKGLKETNKWLTENAKKGEAYISPAYELGKTEREAIIAPGTEFIETKTGKYQKIAKRPVPISKLEMKTKGKTMKGKTISTKEILEEEKNVRYKPILDYSEIPYYNKRQSYPNEYYKESREHPYFTPSQIKQIIRDHSRTESNYYEQPYTQPYTTQTPTYQPPYILPYTTYNQPNIPPYKSPYLTYAPPYKPTETLTKTTPKKLKGREEKRGKEKWTPLLMFGQQRIPTGMFFTKIEDAERAGMYLTDITPYKRFEVIKTLSEIESPKINYKNDKKFYRMPNGVIQERKWAWKDKQQEKEPHMNVMKYYWGRQK